jgi:hypothetical protein
MSALTLAPTSTSIDDEWAAMNASSNKNFKAKNRSTTAGLISLEKRSKKVKKKKSKKDSKKSKILKKPGDDASLAEMVQWINYKKTRKGPSQPQIITSKKKACATTVGDSLFDDTVSNKLKNCSSTDTAFVSTTTTTTTTTPPTPTPPQVEPYKWTVDDFL